MQPVSGRLWSSSPLVVWLLANQTQREVGFCRKIPTAMLLFILFCFTSHWVFPFTFIWIETIRALCWGGYWARSFNGKKYDKYWERQQRWAYTALLPQRLKEAQKKGRKQEREKSTSFPLTHVFLQISITLDIYKQATVHKKMSSHIREQDWFDSPCDKLCDMEGETQVFLTNSYF